MRISKPLLIALLLASCSGGKDPEKNGESSSATFLVDPITSTAEQNKSDANIATSKMYNFTACIKDVAVLEPIIGQKFSIRSGSTEIASKDTDSKGCLTWSEKIEFNAVSQETYIEINRSIEAVSAHKGIQNIRLGVNPWKSTSIDFRFQDQPKGTASNTKGGFYIDTVVSELEFTQSKNSIAVANLKLSFSPKIKRAALDSSTVIDNYSDGKVHLRVQLFARDSNDNIIPLSTVTELTAIGSGTLSKGETTIEVLKKIPRESSIEINFEASPENTSLNLGTAKGVLTLGRMTSLTIAQTSTLKEETIPFNEKSEKNTLITTSEPVLDFLVGTVHIDSFGVTELDANQNPKTLEVQYEASFKNTITQENILNAKFDITPNDGSELPPTSLESGSIKWKEKISFDYNTKEKFIKKVIRFKSKEAFYGNNEKTRTIYINPWQIVNKDKGIYDEFYEGIPPAIPNSKLNSEIILSSAFFNFNRRTFKIDSNLNLSVVRNYQFDIVPKINRVTARGIREEGSGNGRYIIKFLLESADPDFPVVIDAKTMEVESKASSIRANVDFEFKDIRYINSRNTLSIQILPLDHSRSIDSKTYTGTFDPLNGFAVRSEPRQIDIDTRIALTENKPINLGSLSDYFIKKIKSTVLDAKKLYDLKITHKSLLFIDDNKDQLSKACDLFFDPTAFWLWSKSGSCKADPKKFIHVLKTEHVKKVYNSKLAKQIDSSNLLISASLAFYDYVSTDSTSGNTFNMGFDGRLSAGASIPGLKQAGIDIGGSVGVNVGQNWYWTDSTTKGHNQMTGRMNDVNKNLVADEATFAIDADIEKCITLVNKLDKKSPTYTTCSDKAERKTINETYYYISQPVASSAITDASSVVSERALLVLIRGHDRYENFKKTLQDPNATLNFTKNLPSPTSILSESENRYDGFFPGLLTPTP